MGMTGEDMLFAVIFSDRPGQGALRTARLQDLYT